MVSSFIRQDICRTHLFQSCAGRDPPLRREREGEPLDCLFLRHFIYSFQFLRPEYYLEDSSWSISSVRSDHGAVCLSHTYDSENALNCMLLLEAYVLDVDDGGLRSKLEGERNLNLC